MTFFTGSKTIKEEGIEELAQTKTEVEELKKLLDKNRGSNVLRRRIAYLELVVIPHRERQSAVEGDNPEWKSFKQAIQDEKIRNSTRKIEWKWLHPDKVYTEIK